jgi:hypothetical protein
MGAFRVHAMGLTNTGPARKAFMERFEREVDPTGSLPLAERTKRAKAARSAHFKGLALKSSVARAKRAS